MARREDLRQPDPRPAAARAATMMTFSRMRSPMLRPRFLPRKDSLHRRCNTPETGLSQSAPMAQLELSVRPATGADLEAINRIHGPEVLHGTATWVVLPQWRQRTRGTCAWR